MSPDFVLFIASLVAAGLFAGFIGGLFGVGGGIVIVPALYALWFRVRADESRSIPVERPKLAGQVGRGPMPMPIAAE